MFIGVDINQVNWGSFIPLARNRCSYSTTPHPAYYNGLGGYTMMLSVMGPSRDEYIIKSFFSGQGQRYMWRETIST